jgi:hypothetical protein
MACKIFINYRRDDSIAIAGRLHDRLAEAFGRDNLFSLIFQPISKPAVNDLPLVANRTEIEKVRPFFL